MLLALWCGAAPIQIQAQDYVSVVTNTPGLLGYGEGSRNDVPWFRAAGKGVPPSGSVGSHELPPF